MPIFKLFIGKLIIMCYCCDNYLLLQSSGKKIVPCPFLNSAKTYVFNVIYFA